MLADAAQPSVERDIALAFYLGFAREVTGDLEGAIDEHRRHSALLIEVIEEARFDGAQGDDRNPRAAMGRGHW